MKHILSCHEIIRSDIVRGDNCYLYDKNGNRYVDLESGVWSVVLGHSHPRITEAIRRQIKDVIHLGYRYTNFVAEEAAKDLLETIGLPEGKCVFLSSGSEAVEFAVRMAKIVTDKKILLTLGESYLSAHGSAGRKDPAEWVSLDFSPCLICEHSSCRQSCERLADIPFDEVGAFVFEPGSASGTVKFPPDKLIDLIIGEIQRHDGLIVVDEVTTGFGRTGKWYGFNHYDLEPDIVACGKGLGNGYPISAVAMTRRVADELEAKQVHYVQSHQNDPLGCAVVKEVIATLKEETLVDRSARRGRCILSDLRHIADRCDGVEEVRGRGLMIGMQLCGGVPGSPSSALVFKKLLQRGFLIGYDPAQNVIRFLPSLTIEEEEIAHFIGSLERVLNEQAHE
jgi:acetylornithine/N-succinyldiaminopimelate aminotransferase